MRSRFERLVVVAGSGATVLDGDGVAVFQDGDMVAFVNDSGVPFVEQADQLVGQAAGLAPEAVLLGGTALTGRRDGAFRKVLAFSSSPSRPRFARRGWHRWSPRRAVSSPWATGWRPRQGHQPGERLLTH